MTLVNKITQLSVHTSATHRLYTVCVFMPPSKSGLHPSPFVPSNFGNMLVFNLICHHFLGDDKLGSLPSMPIHKALYHAPKSIPTLCFLNATSSKLQYMHHLFIECVTVILLFEVKKMSFDFRAFLCVCKLVLVYKLWS